MLRTIACILHSLLLFSLTNAFGPLLNRTLCCETAILASATDYAHFPLNFALWNSLARLNGTIPPLSPPTRGNDAWNVLVHRKSTENPRAEYLDFRCGAVYSSASGLESPAAMSVRVPLAWARHTPACMGFEGVQLADVDKWAGPLVGFLLPGIVFGLSIPSGWALTEFLRAANLLGHKRPSKLRRLLARVLVTTAFLVLSVLEILRWAIVILTCAGPILSSTMQEMHHDHILLSRLSQPSASTTTQLRRRRLLMAILLSNVSDSNGSLATAAQATILHGPDAQARAYLSILLAANTQFDVAIGTPVAFYTAAYAYALFDAYQRLGDHLTATTLTFGLWYTEFALVAVVSGCLLGGANLAIITSVTYESPPLSPIRLVAPWNRGRSARDWAAWADPEFKLTTPVYKCSIASIVLISLPCCLAFLVSFRTPAAGLGCRSLSLTLYLAAQLLLILLHTLYSFLPDSPCVRGLLYLLLPVTLLLSFLSAVGGTILQITGVFVNVYCVAGVHSFFDPDNPHWSLDLATDTLLVRRLARYRWRYTGVAGLGFLCAVCMITWFYRSDVQNQCARAIAEVQTIPTPAPTPAPRTHFSSTGASTHSRISNRNSYHSRRSPVIEPSAQAQDIRPVSAPSTFAAQVNDVARRGAPREQ
ncbi:beta-glucosidase [Maublancomyces gigas]|uniref:Beta-glucosidase n=1 Tax=Discina gigas TaxID=1032678 RepID=A0ABR3GT54_9PEZI